MSCAPLGGHVGPLKCSRFLGGEFGSDTNEVHCEIEATRHVIWTVDCENGLACETHMDEIRRRWPFYATHPYRMECSMPGSVYNEAENVCEVDEDALGLARAALTAALGGQ